MSKPDWQKKEYKDKHIIFAKKYCKNIAIWQINSWENLFIEIDKNFDKILILFFMFNDKSGYVNINIRIKLIIPMNNIIRFKPLL